MPTASPIAPPSTIAPSHQRRTSRTKAKGETEPVWPPEPDATSAMLEMARVPHREARGVVVVPAAATHGVVLEFAED